MSQEQVDWRQVDEVVAESTREQLTWLEDAAAVMALHLVQIEGTYNNYPIELSSAISGIFVNDLSFLKGVENKLGIKRNSKNDHLMSLKRRGDDVVNRLVNANFLSQSQTLLDEYTIPNLYNLTERSKQFLEQTKGLRMIDAGILLNEQLLQAEPSRT